MSSPTPIEVIRLKEPTIDSAAAGVNANGSALKITWSDGLESVLDSTRLRKACPCASCGEKRGDNSHSKPLGGGRSLLNVVSATISEETDLQRVWPVGNYALGISWGDKHDTGIYHYKLLRKLSEEK
jgi:DUF971 family protein